MNLREWALPVYTIMIQLATGALLALWVIRSRLYSRHRYEEMEQVARIPALIIFATICIAILGAHFHLSKPYLSFLAVLNVGHSWLSREILLTMAFILVMGWLIFLVWFIPGRRRMITLLGWIAIGLGLATIYSMARVYLLPTQLAWNSLTTILSYYGEMLLLGATALSAILLMDLNFYHDQELDRVRLNDTTLKTALKGLAAVSLISLVITLVLVNGHFSWLRAHQEESALVSMRLLLDLYQPLFVARMAMSISGVAWLLLGLWRNLKMHAAIKDMIVPAYFATLLVLVGEILGRFLFYAIHVRIGI